MESILEKLYFGNIAPIDECHAQLKKETELIERLSKSTEALAETMDDHQIELFQKLSELRGQTYTATEIAAFKIGFKLGLRITAESFLHGGGDLTHLCDATAHANCT